MNVAAEDFVSQLSAELDETFEVEEFSETIEIAGDMFTLNCVIDIDDGVFEIRNIESILKSLGKRLVALIQDFCEEYDLCMKAVKVRDSAISFWLKMGLVEGSEPGEFFLP